MFTAAPSKIFLWHDGEAQRAVVLEGTFRWELEFIALTGESYQAACEGVVEQLDEYSAYARRDAALEKAKAAAFEDPLSDEKQEILQRAKENHAPPKIVCLKFAQVCFDLAFAACAKWRAESGWNRTHEKPGDEVRQPRERGPYVAFLDRLRKPDADRLQRDVVTLLHLYNFDPGRAAEATQSGLPLRPNDSPPETTTTP